MASSLIANALQVNFDSVLSIPDNDGMVKMFRALESTGHRGFLGCPSVLYEKELEQFFNTALVKDNEILCVIHGKVVVITEERFAGVLELPTEGLTIKIKFISFGDNKIGLRTDLKYFQNIRELKISDSLTSLRVSQKTRELNFSDLVTSCFLVTVFQFRRILS
ncbi:hypothetical protein F511_44092 [Dorcoceras hygrometricum]|uniref:Uncharacterized protein n=1 Tax=Dorcoceras hygrometricum TaxID=472368 RepID=A0A2Z7AQB6_9LAMI|nr:hypothetical protein F511_44092 [Dorcoceras hygrometricum]